MPTQLMTISSITRPLKSSPDSKTAMPQWIFFQGTRYQTEERSIYEQSSSLLCKCEINPSEGRGIRNYPVLLLRNCSALATMRRGSCSFRLDCKTREKQNDRDKDEKEPALQLGLMVNTSFPLNKANHHIRICKAPIAKTF